MLLVLVHFVDQHDVGISVFCGSTCCFVLWLNMLLVLVHFVAQHAVGISAFCGLLVLVHFVAVGIIVWGVICLKICVGNV